MAVRIDRAGSNIVEEYLRSEVYFWQYSLCTFLFVQDAGYLLDLEIHTDKGLISAGHKMVFHAKFSSLQQFPKTDCLILPDFSQKAIKNLFALLYCPSHR